MVRAKIETYDQWLQQWRSAGRDCHDVAMGLLYRLPEVIHPKGFAVAGAANEEDLSLRDYFRALYGVMSLTMSEIDRDLLGYSRRAATRLLRRCYNLMDPEGGLPVIKSKQSPDGYWNWRRYRVLPQWLLRYFSHPNSHGTKEVEQDVGSSCLRALIGLEEARLRGLDETKPFVWPEFWKEPYRTQLARGVIIYLNVDYLWEMPDLIRLSFDLLCDARDFLWSTRKVDYPRQAKHKWPWLDLLLIEAQLHRLGFILDKPLRVVLAPHDVVRADEMAPLVL